MKTRITVALTVLLILAALTGCGNVGPKDFAAWDAQDLTEAQVTEGIWMDLNAEDPEETPLTEEQLREVISCLNELKEGDLVSGSGVAGGKTIRLSMDDGDVWEVSQSNRPGKVELTMRDHNFSGSVKSKQLKRLLKDLTEE